MRIKIVKYEYDELRAGVRQIGVIAAGSGIAEMLAFGRLPYVVSATIIAVGVVIVILSCVKTGVIK